jgi:hypothetical protein
LPTPVSALLHAATLVTAGVYLLLRCSPILEYSPTALMVITIVGASTAFFAATSGLVQNDLKRIIAFSTISQLGYMVMAIGLSQYNVALFHTVNHAFFKALLFLAAGIIVPALNPAIYWKILYLNNSIIIFEGILILTGLSEGNLILELGEILRGHTQEVININLFDIISHQEKKITFFSSLISAPIFTDASSCYSSCSTTRSFGAEQGCAAEGSFSAALQAERPNNQPAERSAAEVILKAKEGAESFNTNFRSYLAGLIEGDGCFWIPVNHRDSQNKLIYPMITLSFNAKDLPLAMIIQQKLATGHIYKVKGKNAYTYRISNLVNLIKIINIINGFMRTPKINNLNKLIDYLNNKGYSINKYPLDKSPIASNAWLAGFIDSDGHFSVRVSTDKNNLLKRIACSLEISQRQEDLFKNSYFNILSEIGKLLLCNVKETKTKSKNQNPQYRIRTTSLNGNLVLKDYLQKYPLFTSKYLDYKDWNLVLTYFINKEHKIKYNEIVKIKSSMNDRRTFFTWDHLQNFYDLHN